MYLLRIDDVHNHATLQHLRETSLDGEVIAGGTVLLGHGEDCKGVIDRKARRWERKEGVSKRKKRREESLKRMASYQSESTR